MSRAPADVGRFADALLSARIDRLAVPGTKPTIEGIRGVLTTTRLQYVEQPWQLLGRHHEYTFWLPGPQVVEISLQLYENTDEHWRLYAYCAGGMLFSVNLTVAKRDAHAITLGAVLKLATRGITVEARAGSAAALRTLVRDLGYQVDDAGRVALGAFDGRAGKFLDAAPKTFVRDFVLLAVLKGHFMANKGYELPGLKAPTRARVAHSDDSAAARAIPAALRYEVLEAARQRCALCGRSVLDGIRLHVDHVIPWSQGGLTAWGNLRALCDRCNLGKGARHCHPGGTRPRRMA